jgi:hypothetical protein
MPRPSRRRGSSAVRGALGTRDNLRLYPAIHPHVAGDSTTLATTFGRDYCSGICSNRPDLLRLSTVSSQEVPGYSCHASEGTAAGSSAALKILWYTASGPTGLGQETLGLLAALHWHSTYILWAFRKAPPAENVRRCTNPPTKPSFGLEYNRNNGYSRRYQGGPGSSITNRDLGGH